MLFRSACLDITPVFHKDRKYKRVGACLVPGRLIQMDGMSIHAGGVVSNTGLALKKLGVDVKLMAKIGDDDLGKLLLETYKAYDVANVMPMSEGETTSYSVVLAVPGLDRMFLHDPGCNDTFCSEDISDEALEDVGLFHFGYPPLMRKMYAHNGSGLVQLMARLKEKQ